MAATCVVVFFSLFLVVLCPVVKEQLFADPEAAAFLPGALAPGPGGPFSRTTAVRLCSPVRLSASRGERAAELGFTLAASLKGKKNTSAKVSGARPEPGKSVAVPNEACLPAAASESKPRAGFSTSTKPRSVLEEE